MKLLSRLFHIWTNIRAQKHRKSCSSFFQGRDIFLLSAKTSVDNEVNMGEMLITWIELNKRNHPNNGMVWLHTRATDEQTQHHPAS